MGRFAEEAGKRPIDRRGDGFCVAGKWISENLDEDDLKEFERLACNNKWQLICRLSGYELKPQSLRNHVYGGCCCLDDVSAKGCCASQNKES